MLAALAAEGGRVLAGGQSLVPLMAFRLAQPAHLIDINRLDFGGLRVEDGVLRIPATARHAEFERSPVSLLAKVARHIAHVPIRMRGTFCGSLAHADPAAEWPAVFVALGGAAIARSPCGERTIPAHEFCRGIMTTALAEDELLIEARLPLPPAGTRLGFHEVSRRAGDYAMAMAVVSFQTIGAIIDAPVVDGRRRRTHAPANNRRRGRAARRSAGRSQHSAVRPTRRRMPSNPWRIPRSLPGCGGAWCAPWFTGRCGTRCHEARRCHDLGRTLDPPAGRPGSAARRRTVHRRSAGAALRPLRAQPGGGGTHPADRSARRGRDVHRGGSGRGEADPADAVQVWLCADHAAGTRGRGRALSRRSGRGGARGSGGSGRGHRRERRSGDRPPPSRDRCGGRAGRWCADRARRRARQHGGRYAGRKRGLRALRRTR